MRLMLTLALAALVHGAGTVSQTMTKLGDTDNYVITVTWTADASNGSVPATAMMTSSSRLASIRGFSIIDVITDPGSPAPTDNYDLTFVDENGFDVLEAACLDRSTSTTQSCSADPHPIRGTVTVTWANNSVNSATGTIKIILVKNTVAKRGGSGGGTATANSGESFTAQTSVAIAHSHATLNVLTKCYGSGNVEVEPNTVTVDSTSQVTVTFTNAQTGYCVVNGSGGGGGGGGGGSGTVTSVGLTAPTEFSVASSPITTSGTLGLSWAGSQTASRVLATNTSSSAVALRQIDTTYVSAAALSGTGTKFGTTSGTLTSGNCVKFDANGNLVDHGSTCGSGGGGGSYTAGTGLTLVGSTFAVDTASVPTFLTGSISSWDPSSITSGTCATNTATVTGAATGDAVFVGAPATAETGLVWGAVVTATDTVTVRLCNFTGSGVDPGVNTWKVVLIRSF